MRAHTANLRPLAAEPTSVFIFMAGATNGLDKQKWQSERVRTVSYTRNLRGVVANNPGADLHIHILGNSELSHKSPRSTVFAVFLFDAPDGDYETFKVAAAWRNLRPF